VSRKLTPTAVIAIAVILAMVLGAGGYAAYRQHQRAQPPSSTMRTDSAMPASSPGTPGNGAAAEDSVPSRTPSTPLTVEGIIISETETPTLALAQRFLYREGGPRGYHYMVDVDGTVASYFDETRRAGHTSGHNGNTLGIGMIHVSRAGSRQVHAPATAYTRAQIDGLVALLTTLAHDHRLNVQSIRSKEEVDPKYPREITARMDEIRDRVARLLAEWRLNGERPAAARIHTASAGAGR
jgi:N-acetyl-anhydromuramyl-L-alanine amidase AmpD